jgi:ferredoxin
VAPRALDTTAFDPDDPSPKFQRYIKVLMGRGKTREEAIAYIQHRTEHKRKTLEKHRPAIDAFIAEHGIKTQDQLSKAAVQWVLQNPAVGSVCVSMPEFDAIDRFVPLSGSTLSAAAARLLRDYHAALGSAYCRHGCSDCAAVCPAGVSPSTVLRYASYFRHQGRQKLALQKYAELDGRDGSWCIDCDAPCRAACPHGVEVQAQLLAAHGLLTLA